MALSENNLSDVKKIHVADENGNIMFDRYDWFGHYDKSLANLVGYVHIGTHPDGAPIVREKTPYETNEEIKNFEISMEE
jgi:hypothetical protein